ncbi:MAG: sigma-E processing peptidase SpoIIGA [Acutalibacteraceae bacterium]
MIVYADVLIFLNSIITYFLLLGVCAFFKFRPKTFRLILGALFGGVCALVIFLPDLGVIYELLLRFVICTLTVLITFSFKNRIRFIKYSLAFLTITYVFGGAMLALFSMIKPRSMIIANGVTYFNISPLVLILSTAGCYLFIRLLLLFKKSTVNEQLIYNCKLEFKGARVTFQAINDTGNALCDPYFSSPVVIVEKQVLEPILALEPKTYLIPVKSVANSSVLYAFRPDGFWIDFAEKQRKISDITIAICETKIHKQFSGILPTKIIDFTEEQLCLSAN